MIAPSNFVLWLSCRPYRLIAMLYLEHRNARLRAEWWAT